MIVMDTVLAGPYSTLVNIPANYILNQQSQVIPHLRLIKVAI